MPFSFDGDLLKYNGKSIEPDIRRFGQMRPVLAFPEREGLSPDEPTYYMYRGADSFRHVRYDITKIEALDLAGERNKTMGHVHPRSPKGAAWPEIYEVLSGEAHFLLQKVTQLGVQDAALLSGKKGDCLLIPPGYGHVTINAGNKCLLLANLVCELFESDYGPYLSHRGACYYETIEGRLIRNQNYGGDFELRQLRAGEFSSVFGCFAPFEKGLLAAAKDYANIEFLAKPETFY